MDGNNDENVIHAEVGHQPLSFEERLEELKKLDSGILEFLTRKEQKTRAGTTRIKGVVSGSGKPLIVTVFESVKQCEHLERQKEILPQELADAKGNALRQIDEAIDLLKNTEESTDLGQLLEKFVSLRESLNTQTV